MQYPNRLTHFFLSILWAALWLSQARASAWTKGESPEKFIQAWNIPSVTHQLRLLPLQGKVADQNMPWSSSYLPAKRNGALYPWNRQQKKSTTVILNPEYALFFKTSFPTEAEVVKMSREELAQLSPLEKYSIFVGDFSYSLAKRFQKENHPDDPYWKGMCDAWSAVSLDYPEPRPVDVKRGNLTIPFGSSDLKALMILSYHQKMKSRVAMQDYIQLAQGCNRQLAFPKVVVRSGKETFSEYADTAGLLESDYEHYLQAHAENSKRIQGEWPWNENSASKVDLEKIWITKKIKESQLPSCSGINAGAFHLILANQIGIFKKGFAFDRSRDVEVWNQPAFAYTSTLGEPRLNPKIRGGEIIPVHTSLRYADDTVDGWGFWQPTLSALFHLPSEKAFQAEYENYQEYLFSIGDPAPADHLGKNLYPMMELQYELETNAGGEIVGGSWVTFDRPDYLWIFKKQSFEGDFARLNELLKPAFE